MERYDVANEDNSLPTCEQFTTNTDFDEHVARAPGCEVCGHLELSHPVSGHRMLGTSAITELRGDLIAESTDVEKELPPDDGVTDRAL